MRPEDVERVWPLGFQHVNVLDATRSIWPSHLHAANCVRFAIRQIVVSSSIQEAAAVALRIERAARLQLLAQAAGQIQPISDELAREAHDFLLQPSIVRASFAAYGRPMLRSDPSCLR